MIVPVAELKGMSAELAAKLVAQGLTDSEKLVMACKTPLMRTELAKKLGMKAAEILEFANRADLVRMKGIGRVFSDLLENAGVDTVKELAKRVPANLLDKLVAINAEKKLAGRDPRIDEVENWVSQAKNAGGILEY